MTFFENCSLQLLISARFCRGGEGLREMSIKNVEELNSVTKYTKYHRKQRDGLCIAEDHKLLSTPDF